MKQSTTVLKTPLKEASHTPEGTDRTMGGREFWTVDDRELDRMLTELIQINAEKGWSVKSIVPITGSIGYRGSTETNFAVLTTALCIAWEKL